MNAQLLKNLSLCLAMTLFSMITVLGQKSTDFVQSVKMSKDQLVIETNGQYQHFILEIVGPDNFLSRKEITKTSTIRIPSLGLPDKAFQDGRYQLQLTPSVLLTIAEQKKLRYLMATEQVEKVAAAKALYLLPEKINKYNWYFSIEAQTFVLPEKESGGLKLSTDDTTKSLSALSNTINAVPTAQFTSLLNNPKPQFVDVVYADDVIVDGSICVGQDCVNGESFGFDTQRMKENNLRIHFNDTSASASFPSNDWRININDATNGGSNYFGIEDATAGTMPFRVDAGAGDNALFVGTANRVGFGTSTPAKTIHMTKGDSPTLRLEQDGTGGFNPQTWDIGGNEANFFLKDVSNSSTIPFKIASGAPANSFCIAANGNITTVGTINGSDRRLKKEISALSEMLPLIQQLQPKQYYFRPEFGLSTQLQFGLIAQEVERLLPHVVADINQTTPKGETLKGINYTALVPVLIKGMQEQQEEIDHLKEQLAQMKMLQSEVAALAKLMHQQQTDTAGEIGEKK